MYNGITNIFGFIDEEENNNGLFLSFPWLNLSNLPDSPNIQYEIFMTQDNTAENQQKSIQDNIELEQFAQGFTATVETPRVLTPESISQKLAELTPPPSFAAAEQKESTKKVNTKNINPAPIAKPITKTKTCIFIGYKSPTQQQAFSHECKKNVEYIFTDETAATINTYQKKKIMSPSK